VNTEERQLAELLHRVTPEPPRRVTVEDVAFRLANEAGRARGGHREPRAWRGPGRNRGRGWAPVLAAASVFVVAGASAGIAAVMTSHHSHATSLGDGMPPSSASVTTPATSTAPSQPSTSARATWPPEPVAAGMWGAELINRQSFTQNSLVSSGGSLYAVTGGYLDRIDPATGNIVQTAPYSPPVLNQPVVMGNTVWVVWSYSGGNVVLHGYDARSLAQVTSLSVPAIGRVSSAAQGVLTGGPDGKLYLAAGETVAIVDPATGHLIRRIYLTAGAASSVAVSPDRSKLYVGTVPSTPSSSFRLLTYDLATGVQSASSTMAVGGAGNLVATSGGVWGTAGIGMSEWVWFAPGGDLSQEIRVSQGAGAGLASVPTFSGGAVWIGGSHTLACANPATGQVMASTAIPTDNGVVEYFGSVTVAANGRTYALYQNQAAQQSGVATLTPPAACSA
jgi:hypothetical protein